DPCGAGTAVLERAADECSRAVRRERDAQAEGGVVEVAGRRQLAPLLPEPGSRPLEGPRRADVAAVGGRADEAGIAFGRERDADPEVAVADLADHDQLLRGLSRGACRS